MPERPARDSERSSSVSPALKELAAGYGDQRKRPLNIARQGKIMGRGILHRLFPLPGILFPSSTPVRVSPLPTPASQSAQLLGTH